MHCVRKNVIVTKKKKIRSDLLQHHTVKSTRNSINICGFLFPCIMTYQEFQHKLSQHTSADIYENILEVFQNNRWKLWNLSPTELYFHVFRVLVPCKLYIIHQNVCRNFSLQHFRRRMNKGNDERVTHQNFLLESVNAKRHRRRCRRHLPFSL